MHTNISNAFTYSFVVDGQLLWKDDASHSVIFNFLLLGYKIENFPVVKSKEEDLK